MTLAAQHEPLVLYDGTVIDPVTGREVPQQHKRVEVPRHSEAVRTLTAVRRRLSELPAPPREMNAISIVCFYTMLGVEDHDIGVATGLTAAQVGRIRMQDAYQTVYREITAAILDADAGNVRLSIQRAAQRAADRQIELVESEDEKIALGASNSVLDRAGHRPVDVVEHRIRSEQSLVIEIIKRDDTAAGATPVVPVEYEEVEDADA